MMIARLRVHLEGTHENPCSTAPLGSAGFGVGWIDQRAAAAGWALARPTNSNPPRAAADPKTRGIVARAQRTPASITPPPSHRPKRMSFFGVMTPWRAARNRRSTRYMNYRHYSKLHEVWNRVTNAEYCGDPGAVADAIVRRRWTVAIGPEPAQVSVIASHRWTRTRVRRDGRSRRRTRTQALA
jgi:hypothetical protein